MSGIIKYPVGVQTFQEIVEGGYLYVDKTRIVHQLVNKSKYVFLSRPRRFGKSLLISTIEAYFNARRELFKGLAIDSLESEWAAYPVLRFDLSGQTYDHPDRVTEKLAEIMGKYEAMYGFESPDNSMPIRFSRLIRQTAQKTGQRVVILIDEYDKPMLGNLHDEKLHEKMRRQLHGFYSVIKENDAHIRFAMITGVTKFSHLSIFSGLNNLKDISMSIPYGTICGITESEFHACFKEPVRDFAECNGLTEEEIWRRFKAYYDGYHFCEKSEDIYNPFSVIRAFDDCRLSCYWYSSGTPTFLVKLLDRHGYEFAGFDEEERTESQLMGVNAMSDDLIPLLYQAGYLTIKDYDSLLRVYRLGFPNREVRQGFFENLWETYIGGQSRIKEFSIASFMRAIYGGDTDLFLNKLKAFYCLLPSSHERNKEVHFQNVMTALSTLCGCIVHTEYSTACGRCDMKIFTPAYIYIFEFKVDQPPEKAMEQIREKNYAGPYMTDAREKILAGVSFSTHTRTLSGWEIERMR